MRPPRPRAGTTGLLLVVDEALVGPDIAWGVNNALAGLGDQPKSYVGFVRAVPSAL